MDTNRVNTDAEEDVDVYDTMLNKLQHNMDVDEVIYSLNYRDVLTVIQEAYGDKALLWDLPKLLRVMENVKNLMCESVTWFEPACISVGDSESDDEDEGQ